MISMDNDDIDLGPRRIITIKNGFVGVSWNKGVLQLLQEGRHELNLPDQRFERILSLQQEVVELPALDVKTTDNIQVVTHAVLNYRIVDPVKAVTNVDNLEKSIEEIAEVTLSSILRRLSLRELSPSVEEIVQGDDRKGKGKAKHLSNERQAQMFDDFHADFCEIVSEWGVEIIGHVQLKTIEPRDTELKRAIAQNSINTAKADAQRRQAEFDADVMKTQSDGKRTALVIAAHGDNEALLIRAKGENEAMIMRSKGDNEARLIKARGENEAKLIAVKGESEMILLKAEAEAEAIKMIAEARMEATKSEGLAAEALTTPVAQQLAILREQGSIMKECKNPVYFPSTEEGTMKIWNKEGNTVSFVTNHRENEDSSSALLNTVLMDKIVN
eukprot:TRINITY_DN1839_c0_g1_i1.p1 TRINITY_DN1839_c0_g1~~TRINITY_DN1839_c0_g1_i1.p1  ORF type:complete len:387 (-),score=109.64 TRINITY_DN1839_c0_g1_i1:136-1296(-)